MFLNFIKKCSVNNNLQTPSTKWMISVHGIHAGLFISLLLFSYIYIFMEHLFDFFGEVSNVFISSIHSEEISKLYLYHSLSITGMIISLTLISSFFFFFGLLVFHWTCHSWLCSGKKIFTQYNILYLVFVSFYVSHHSSISKVWNISHTLCTNNIINVNDPTSLKSVPRINANLHWTASSSFLVKTTATFLLR